MLEDYKITELIQNKLNEYGKDYQPNYKFTIFLENGDIGKIIGAENIAGIFRTITSDVKPIKDYTNIIYDDEIYFIITAPRCNYYIEDFKQMAYKLRKELNGIQIPIDSGKAIITFKIPTFEDWGEYPSVGYGTRAVLRFKVDYSEKAVTTSDSVFMLNDLKMKYEKAWTLLEKEGTTNSVYGAKSSKTLPVKQTLLYGFLMPFDGGDPCCVMLQQDMLIGDMTKTYDLKNVDGVAFTDENPLVKTVSLYRTNKVEGTTPGVLYLEVYFAEVDKPLETTGVQYYLALIDNPFDESNVNQRFFTNVLTQYVNGDDNVTVELSNGDGVMSTFYYKNYIMNEETGVFTTLNKINNFADFKVGEYYYVVDNERNLTTIKVNQIIGGDYLRMIADFSEQRSTVFSTAQDSQRAYYEDKVVDGAPYTQIKAPNLNSLTLTQQVYINTSNKSLFELLTKNYAIIKVVNLDTNKVIDYFYYYIQSANVGANNQILLDLKMDSIQTYYFKPDIEFSDCLINRAHLNRWIDNGDGTVSFDGTPTSKLFGQDEVKNFPKRLVSRNQFSLLPNRFGGGIEIPYISKRNLEFCDKYLVGWAYIFVDPIVIDGNKEIPKNVLGLPENVRRLTEVTNGNRFTMPYVVLALPILKDEATIMVNVERKNKTLQWDFYSFMNSFVSQITPYVLDIRISQTPILPNFNFFDMYSFTDASIYNVLTINDMNTSDPGSNTFGEFAVIGETGNVSGYMIYVAYSHEIGESRGLVWSGMNSRTIDTNFKYKFNKSEIINQMRNKNLNPKLLSQNFTEVRIGQGLGQPFVYDPQKFNNNTLLMIWRESIVPAITRSYLSLVNNDSAIFNPIDTIYNLNTYQSLIGCTSSQDTSMPYEINQLKQYLALNKNFNIQRDVGMIQGALNVATGTSMGVANTNFNTAYASNVKEFDAALLGGMGVAANTITGGINLIANRIQSNLTLDNMKNAPQTFKNLDGNPLMTIAINGGQTYVEIWQALEQELKIADDFIYKNGFVVNITGNLKNYVNNRNYFNFIQVQIEQINGVSISNNARIDIKSRLQNGIRFWNSDNIQYELENYEKSLTT